MIERILLATDRPGACAAAAGVADLFAVSQPPAEVDVLHVNAVEYTTPPEGAESTDPSPNPRKLANDPVADLPRLGIAARAEVRCGVRDDVAADIVVEAKSSGVGLIPISCRPRPRLRYALTGRDSRAVIVRVARPLLVVREPRHKV